MLETVQGFLHLTGGLWDTTYFGNSVGAWVSAFGVFLCVYLILCGVQILALTYFSAFAKRSKNTFDDVIVRMVQEVQSSVYFLIALWVGVIVLEVPSFLSDAIWYVLLIIFVYQIIHLAGILIDFFLKRNARKNGEVDTTTPLRIIGTLAKGSLWVFGAILILQNFGVEVTSLIAGLGIGGLAIGLALQNILSDLFSSFAIYFDKPFVVGDVIKVGEHVGTVERIGIKTTRLRSPQGEEIIMSNTELTEARIQNFKRLSERLAFFILVLGMKQKQKNLLQFPRLLKTLLKQ
jgi:small-conductance mechanosensitive channel